MIGQPAELGSDSDALVSGDKSEHGINPAGTQRNGAEGQYNMHQASMLMSFYTGGETKTPLGCEQTTPTWSELQNLCSAVNRASRATCQSSPVLQHCTTVLILSYVLTTLKATYRFVSSSCTYMRHQGSATRQFERHSPSPP